MWWYPPPVQVTLYGGHERSAGALEKGRVFGEGLKQENAAE